MKKLPDGKYEKICIGTTTTTRMDRFVPGLIKQYGVRAMVGKGGVLAGHRRRDEGSTAACISRSSAARRRSRRMQIEEIEEVWWEDLMPECFWKFRVKDFGPLIVAIDAHGNSHYRRIQERAAERMKSFRFD